VGFGPADDVQQLPVRGTGDGRTFAADAGDRGRYREPYQRDRAHSVRDLSLGLSSLAYTATQIRAAVEFCRGRRTWLATPSGILANNLGWVGFWLFTVAVAVPGMALLWILWRKGFVVESVRQTKEPPPTAEPAAKAAPS
jgi:hypothetical protein